MEKKISDNNKKLKNQICGIKGKILESQKLRKIYENDIYLLKEELNRMESLDVSQQIQQENSNLEQENANLKSELDDLKNKIIGKGIKNADSAQSVSLESLSMKSENENFGFDQLQAVNDIVDSKLKALKKAQLKFEPDYKSKIELTSERNSLQQKISQLEEDNRELEFQVQVQIDRLNTIKTPSQNISEIFGEPTDQYNEVQLKLEQSENETALLREKLEKIQLLKKSFPYNDKVDFTLCSAAEQLDQQISENERLIQTLKNQNDEIQNEIFRSNQEIGNLKDHREELSSKLSSLQTKSTENQDYGQEDFLQNSYSSPVRDNFSHKLNTHAVDEIEEDFDEDLFFGENLGGEDQFGNDDELFGDLDFPTTKSPDSQSSNQNVFFSDDDEGSL